MAAPTQKELEVLKQFRERMSDVKLEGNRNSDLYWMSWLRARDLDLVKAEDMFRKSLAWREANGIDQIGSWKPPPGLEALFPFQISGFDKDGCPVGITPFGTWDVKKYIEQGNRDLYIKYNDFIFNRLIESTQVSDSSFTQFINIFDLAGYSFRQLTGHGCVDAVLEVVKRFEANHPERMKCCYCINAPKIFSILFALVKPLLSPVTLAKIRIYGTDKSKWKLALLNNIPADQLPIAYGGTASTSIKLLDAVSTGVDNEVATELIEVTVGAGEKLEVEYKIRHPNSKLSWRYKTENFDIGFSVKYENKLEVVGYERVEAQLGEQNGSLVCDKAGRYTLVFDNTYSVVRPKTLHYIVNVDSPDDSDDENTDL